MLPLRRREIQQALREQGYAVLGEPDLGLAPEVRAGILSQYFRDGVLAPEHPGMKPVDRLRARDVIGYCRLEGGELKLWESSSISLTTPEGLIGEHLHGVARDFTRVEVLGDPGFNYWVETVLSIIPDGHRFGEGTFGINLFRTFTNVVSGPHQDKARYFVVSVLDRVGDGAETTLHDMSDPTQVLFRQTLASGQSIVVDDERYLHDVGPLIGDDCRRDALVGMVYYPN